MILLQRCLAAVACLATAGCVLVTDAATRLAEDVVQNAGILKGSLASERAFVHHPKSWPSGCKAAYTIVFQEGLHHPARRGSLLVGCAGESSFDALGYSYSTSYHLTAVSVPQELSIAKKAGSDLKVTLRKQREGIEVIRIE